MVSCNLKPSLSDKILGLIAPGVRCIALAEADDKKNDTDTRMRQNMRLPKKTFQKLPAEKQARITEAAIDEFASKGFDGASINTIVERLKIAKGSIFQYFGDKKGLFLFVFNRSVEMVKSYLKAVRDKTADEPLATRLKQTLTAGIDFIRQHPRLYRLYVKVLFESRLPFREELLLSLRQHSMEFLGSLLENAQSRGELRSDFDIAKASFVLDALMDRFLQAYMTPHLDANLGIYHAKDAQISVWIDEIVSIILTGVESPATPFLNLDNDGSDSPEILIVAAIREELSTLIQHVEDRIETSQSGFTRIDGRICDIRVALLATGPGQVNTAHALTMILSRQRPKLIIQTGCGGAFKSAGLKIGDIAVATEEVDAQLGIEPDAQTFPVEDLPFPILTTAAKQYTNRYPLDASLAELAAGALKSVFTDNDAPQVAKGTFITVSTVTATGQTAEFHDRAFRPCMEQMEGAATAHLSLRYGIPLIEIRSASNIVGIRKPECWDVPLASHRAGNAVYELIHAAGAQILNKKSK